MAIFLIAVNSAGAQQPCKRVVRARIVSLDQPYMWNRLGTAAPGGLIFALERDVVPMNNPTNALGMDTTLGRAEDLRAGQVRLRGDKRPRPIVLRARVGDCLEIHLRNLLSPAPPTYLPASLQVPTRRVGVHIMGLHLLAPQPGVAGINSDGSFAGANPNSYAAPGETKIYKYHAAEEGAFLLYSGAGDEFGQTGAGLFGAVNVQPESAEWYRSQVTRADLHEATFRADQLPPNMSIKAALGFNGQQRRTPEGQLIWLLTTVIPETQTVSEVLVIKKFEDEHLYTLDSHPIINYNANFQAGPKAGTPVLNMLQPAPAVSGQPQTLDVAHTDLTAIITGPNTGRFPFTVNGPGFNQNPASPDRRQPYREFTIHYHNPGSGGNIPQVVQPFRQFYDDQLRAVMGAGADNFAINYGMAGIGSEIVANRLGVGPMGKPDAVDLKYEEFFLSSWAVGDPSMVVDVPANAPNQVITNPKGGGNAVNSQALASELSSPPLFKPVDGNLKAKQAFYPDDPSNVYHSYIRDHTKFRIIHAGPNNGQSHVHHLHAHQWLHSPNSDDSSYLDSQMIVPGAAYTLEMVYNGSGNRNQTVGDSIFHCHFYPHFAQGMWSLWRTHDVFEAGTEYDPADGLPKRGWNRVLPDGEIERGTPIPALVPLPTIGMAPLPAKVRLTTPEDGYAGRRVIVEPAEVKSDGEPVYNNPGFPFFIPGVSGHRAPHPPIDFAWVEDEPGKARLTREGKKIYLDGGLPRHLPLDGKIFVELHNRWDFSKDFVLYGKDKKTLVDGNLKAFELPEEGTAVERAAMRMHAQRAHLTAQPDGNPGNFILNGLPPAPGAPYADPSVDDNGNSTFNARRYKAAAIQTDVVLNKKGWHYPQQRMLTLWYDVKPTIEGKRPPQPFFFRSATGDTVEFWHTNLVPNYYELDDFQVRTPTDILGQHIHLVKFDVTSSDGGGNGFNYEDGTFSPDEVRERIFAINKIGGLYNFDPRTQFAGSSQKTLRVVPYQEHYAFFGPQPRFQNWDGAQTTIQRYDTDPLLNDSGFDRTLRSVFTHDHFGPSTHQQAGLYAAMLVEPQGSKWQDPITGELMYTRDDGGPTSWQANIITANTEDSYREFAMEFQDFQLAYLPYSRSEPGPAPASSSLFYAGWAAAKGLDQRVITAELRETFARFGVPLSSRASVTVKIPGKEWEIGNPTPPNQDEHFILRLADASLTGFLFDMCTLIINTDKFTCSTLANQLNTASTIANAPDVQTIFTRKGITLSSTDPITVITSGKQWRITHNYSKGGSQQYSVTLGANNSLNVSAQTILFNMCANLASSVSSCSQMATNLNSQSISSVKSTFSNFGITLASTASIKVISSGKQWVVTQPVTPGYSQTLPGEYPITKDSAGNLNVYGLLIYAPDTHAGWSDPVWSLNPPTNRQATIPGAPFPTLVSTASGKGTYSVNYRNEPTPYRVNPSPTDQVTPDNPQQAVDLSHVFRSIKRYDAQLNKQPAPGALIDTSKPNGFRFPVLPLVPETESPAQGGATGTDPYTPLLRAYQNDRVQIRSIVGAHTVLHPFQIQGARWFFEPANSNSGHQSVQGTGLSEHYEFLFTTPRTTTTPDRPFGDYLYAPSAGTDGIVNGLWGIIRAYDPNRVQFPNLIPLPNNKPATYQPNANVPIPPTCPAGAPQRTLRVTAVYAKKALAASSGGALVYNSRGQATAGSGTTVTYDTSDPISDPNALMYVRTEDLDSTGKLKSGVPVEPLVLRAAAGECINIELSNQLSGFAGSTSAGSVQSSPFGKGNVPNVTLNTSLDVGLNAQLLTYDVTTSNGGNVGFNPVQTVASTSTQPGKLQWFAGKTSTDPEDVAASTPVEFGSLMLSPSDPLLQHQGGLVGTLVIEPKGSTWCEDAGTRTSATVYAGSIDCKNLAARAAARPLFREFTVMMQNDIENGNLTVPADGSQASGINYRSEPFAYRYAGGAPANGDYFQSESNSLVQQQNSDPQTPIFVAATGTPVRFRWVFGGGTALNSEVPTIHGHNWLEEPWVNDSTQIGANPFSQVFGSQIMVPFQPVNMVVGPAGGEGGVPGDYMFHTYQDTATGMWGLFRVGDSVALVTSCTLSGTTFQIEGFNAVKPGQPFAKGVTVSLVKQSGSVTPIATVNVNQSNGTWAVKFAPSPVPISVGDKLQVKADGGPANYTIVQAP